MNIEKVIVCGMIVCVFYGYVCVNSWRRPGMDAGVQKPWMAWGFHVLVAWIPAIPAGVMILPTIQLSTRT